MTNDHALILSLRMKTSPHSGAACKIDDAVDFLHAMISKEQVYKCRDYLGRRGTKVHNIFVELGIECAPLEIEDIIGITSREKMCDWTYRVCDFFRMNREIVALSFSFLDRFLDRCTCTFNPTVFKLASMTTLFMAAKVFHPKQISISCLAELSRGEFNMSDLAAMERIILQALDWRLNPPTVQSFIGYLMVLLPLCAVSLARSIQQRAIFFAELCCYDYRFATQDRSLIAVSCILIALEDTDNDVVSRDLRQDFLETIRLKLSLQFEGTEMATSQSRLLHLYTCSSQAKEVKIIPLLHVPRWPSVH
jgi:hypothetical protein